LSFMILMGIHFLLLFIMSKLLQVQILVGLLLSLVVELICLQLFLLI
jgi:hypothetical protein